jgi:hypothetical protein
MTEKLKIQAERKHTSMVDAPALAGCEGELQLSLHWNKFDNY